MDIPKRHDLPFFAYGIFKPGQLAYQRIGEFVCRSEENCQVHGELRIRDGLPILNPDGGGSVRGTILFFEPGATEKAYQRIVEIEPDKQYKWGVAPSGNQSVNLLLGRSPRKGSTEAETSEWDGRNDPLFTAALDVVGETLVANWESGWDLKPTFRLQMAYLLLWSSIERYVSMRYHLGDNATAKLKYLAEEPAFCRALQANVKSKRSVFRADRPDKAYLLDASQPQESREYYYQVRCNIMHRGKGIPRDHEIVRDSLSELLTIFTAVKDAAFEFSQPTGGGQSPSGASA
jgi:hypothetical protein